MTLLECPNCHRQVDIDRRDIDKKEDGLALIIKCPSCEKRFIVQRVAQVRETLREAEYGFKRNEEGRMVKVKL